MTNDNAQNTSKRILMLNYEFPPLGGGGGVAAKKMAEGFVGLGYSVDYLTSWYKGLKKEENINGINVIRIKVLGRKEKHTASLISMISFVAIALRKAAKLCNSHDYLFVNTHFVVPTGPLGHFITNKFNVRHVLSLHGGDIYDPSKKLSPHKHVLLRKLIRSIINKTDFVVAQSSNTKANTYKYYAPEKEINIIPLPYHVRQYKTVSKKALGLDENKKYIISVGRLIKRKCYNDFIKVLHLLPTDVEGIIVGDGPEKSSIIDLAKELGVNDRLHMPGFISEEEKFQLLENCELYLLTSLHEGFGIVIQEAFQAGLPIVGTNNGGQIDMITENENGYLVDVHDIDKMAEKVKLIINNTHIKERISANNKAKLKQYETLEICKEYLCLLEG